MFAWIFLISFFFFEKTNKTKQNKTPSNFGSQMLVTESLVLTDN